LERKIDAYTKHNGMMSPKVTLHHSLGDCWLFNWLCAKTCTVIQKTLWLQRLYTSLRYHHWPFC